MKYTFIPLKFQLPCRLWEWLWYIHGMTAIVQHSILSPYQDVFLFFFSSELSFSPAQLWILFAHWETNLLATVCCFPSGVGKRVTWAYGCIPAHLYALRHHEQQVRTGETELKVSPFVVMLLKTKQTFTGKC